uniref:SAM domain-containing protein n=1 Tax=Daphnia galeata TaxID=27404 RepID=A0A8J2WTE9_9CRUS|nr:unnamed protein product [Daphnia galeata]
MRKWKDPATGESSQFPSSAKFLVEEKTMFDLGIVKIISDFSVSIVNFLQETERPDVRRYFMDNIIILVEWVSSFTSRMSEVILVDTLESSGPLGCILNGDYWNHNILFQYVQGTNIPLSLRRLDFQMSRIGHPFSDVVYFLYASTMPENREKRERSEGSPLQSQVQGVLEDSQRPHQSLNDHKTQLGSPQSPQINLAVELDTTSKLSEHQIFLIEAKEIDQRIQMINAMARQLLQHPNSQEIERDKSTPARKNSLLVLTLSTHQFQFLPLTKFMSEEKMMCMATISTSDSPSNIYIQILDQQFKKFHILENEMNIVLNNAAIKLESSQIQIGMICAMKNMDKWTRYSSTFQHKLSAVVYSGYKDGHQISLNKTLCERKLVKQCAELDSLTHNQIRAEIATELMINQTGTPLDGASAREEITFEILLELDHAKLKDIGIHAYGHRNLLLNNMLDKDFELKQHFLINHKCNIKVEFQ